MRGKAAPSRPVRQSSRITPAYAGKSRLCYVLGCFCKDHPRVCGEKKVMRGAKDKRMGSPPRMRGKACLLATGLHDLGITPAYAGKSKRRALPALSPGDHPPHVRGKERSTACNAGAGGITPACAGKSTVRWVCQSPGWDHPRVCGGKDRQSRCTRITPGITPAYAGKRGMAAAQRLLNQDHPRVCGEKCC